MCNMFSVFHDFLDITFLLYPLYYTFLIKYVILWTQSFFIGLCQREELLFLSVWSSTIKWSNSFKYQVYLYLFICIYDLFKNILKINSLNIKDEINICQLLPLWFSEVCILINERGSRGKLMREINYFLSITSEK